MYVYTIYMPHALYMDKFYHTYIHLVYNKTIIFELKIYVLYCQITHMEKIMILILITFELSKAKYKLSNA